MSPVLADFSSGKEGSIVPLFHAQFVPNKQRSLLAKCSDSQCTLLPKGDTGDEFNDPRKLPR